MISATSLVSETCLTAVTLEITFSFTFKCISRVIFHVNCEHIGVTESLLAKVTLKIANFGVFMKLVDVRVKFG